jgi:capsular polysaccharide biosynthesis protein
VRGVQLELLPFTEQLRLVGETDILLGMHGAGLSHMLFLPRHGALIEFEPIGQGENMHFAELALWRRLVYSRWRNDSSKNEVRVITLRGKTRQTVN